MRYDHLPEGVRPWKTVWSAGQGIEIIRDLPGVAELVLRLRREYVEACEVPHMADVARLVDEAGAAR
jgi:nitronate monooxygenase